MKILIIFLMLSVNAYAQEEVVFNADSLEYKHDGETYQAEEVPLSTTFDLKKPVIDEDKILDEKETKVVEFSLKENDKLLIDPRLKPVKNDYKNDFDRGTVEYNEKVRNYSFHKIIIPDGTTIKDTNFSQKEPFSDVIEGEDLTFVDCNLVNVAIHPSWILKNSNNAQIKRTQISDEDLGAGKRKLKVSQQVFNEDSKIFEEKEIDEKIYSDLDSYNLGKLRLNE